MIWDKGSLFCQLEIYAFNCDKSSLWQFRCVADLRRWVLNHFGWCPDRMGTLEVLESVLWFLGSPDANPPKEPWCCGIGDVPFKAMTTRRIPISEIKRLRGEGKTLQAIADIAGLSRERVRQILKK